MPLYCPNPECPDRRENGEPGEYREGTTVCPYCGTPLVRGEPAPQDDPALRESAGKHEGDGAHEVMVFLASDPTEAAMITGLLEEHDIPCFQRVAGLHGEPALFSARWAPVPGQRYEIVVAQASEREARRLLEDTLGPDAGQPQPAGMATVARPAASRHEEEGRTRRDPWILVLLVLLAVTLLSTAIAWVLGTLR
ncbi:MAG: DUF2007 domain-containing protein [Acidobacteria bacterium]|nr:DUF2007 domain-containing protein [Acidobacteriota bacterium]